MAVIGGEADIDFGFGRHDVRRKDVPNHILDTKIYAKVGNNKLFNIKPESVHFAGYTLGHVQSEIIHIINISSECQRMHILPPVTSNFKIKYKKKQTLVPGFHLEVTVEFKASDYGHYCDCIRIHSKDEENLIVPLHAYPICDIIFPKSLDFKAVPVGESKTRKIPLKSDVPVDFEFEIDVLQKNGAFNITPLRGIIPGNGQVDVKVTYSPSEFCTSILKMQLRTSQFNSNVYNCTCNGFSMPGLIARLKEKEIPEATTNVSTSKILDPRTLSPLGRSRIKRKEKNEAPDKDKDKDAEDYILCDGIRFPKDFNNPASVSYVLTQKAGKLKTKDLRAAVKAQKDQEPTGKQMKEAVFEHFVQQIIKEEERNQLRWCVKLGEDPLLPVARRKIIEDREKAVTQFKVITGEGRTGDEFDRSSTFCDQARVHRPAGFIPEKKPTFDIYLNDTWEKRQMVLHKFIQAAWKIIIRARATKCLLKIAKTKERWRKGDFKDVHINMNELNDEEKIVYNFSLRMTEDQIKPRSFLKPEDIDDKRDLSLDVINAVTVPPTTLNLKDDVPFFNLVIPLEYKVLGYQPYTIDYCTRNYTPPGLCRQLRTEANEDHSSKLHSHRNVSDLMRVESVEDFAKQDKQLETDSTLPMAETKMTTDKIDKEPFIKLEIPQALLEAPKHHPMHIFNPLPGAYSNVAFKYEETFSDESRLSQVISTDRDNVGLDRKDVIPGVLNWRKFSNPGLVASNHMPTLSNIYVPQWNSPVNEGILLDPPPLLSGIPEDDRLDLDDEQDEDDSQIIIPTMDMIRAQFVVSAECECKINTSEISGDLSRLPHFNQFTSKSALVTREQRVQELETYIKERTNRLGKQLETNIKALERFK